MEHRIGTINLIRWQGRRNRRLRPGVPLWTVLMVACAAAGSVMLAAQALGVLTWPPPLSALPVGLLLLSIGGQIFAVGRALLIWLGG